VPGLLWLDVGELEPPEPLERILTELRRLPASTALCVQHRREPLPLYPLLAELGFDHQCIQHPTGAVTLYIWPQHDQTLAEFCRELRGAH
jgi:hypothetical protein